jgi:formylglycine-generating enzyme required for sulfatase activity
MVEKKIDEPGTITYISEVGATLKIKTILHPDYWVEIPAGEFLIGVSEQQREMMGSYLRKIVGYHSYSWERQDQIESAVVKIRLRAKLPPGQKLDPHLEFTKEEKALWDGFVFGKEIVEDETKIARLPEQETVWLDRFYIARFPITERQWGAFRDGIPGNELPGTFDSVIPKTLDYTERPEARRVMMGTPTTKLRELNAAIVDVEGAVKLCEQIGGRLPTILEWQKAAIGTDGRLYPWGDEWNSNAGYFFRVDGLRPHLRVNAYLGGVSPYVSSVRTSCTGLTG